MEQIIAELLKLGLPGIFIGYLIWCCWEKDKRYDTLAKLTNELQERRASERAENAKVMAESAAAQKQLGEGVAVAVETMAAAVRSIEYLREYMRNQK